MKDRLATFLGAVAILAILVGSALTWAKAPCGLWTLSRVGDMPARCLKH